MSQEYWNKTHVEKYSKTEWSKKPSIFATQSVKFFPETGILLEIGTGQGGDADYFQSLGYEVTLTFYKHATLHFYFWGFPLFPLHLVLPVSWSRPARSAHQNFYRLP